jgi:hypothetical protein
MSNNKLIELQQVELEQRIELLKAEVKLTNAKANQIIILNNEKLRAINVNNALGMRPLHGLGSI